MKALRVLRSGPLTLVEDLGRHGLASIGVGRSGAMDRAALALANRLVGNSSNTAGLEILIGDAEFQAEGDVWVAVTGARGELTVDGKSAEPNSAILLAAGSRLSVPPADHGLRYYVAVRGGIDLAEVLGSTSRDTLALLGPEPVRDGDILPVGLSPINPIPVVDYVSVAVPDNATVHLEVRPGPRRGWFGPESWSKLFETEWTVSPRSDRRGLRLEGPVLGRVKFGELVSEGTLPGAIQVSPDGAPTILAVDHPVTGGYPVIAVVTDAHLDSLGQLRPGQGIRFRLATGH